MKYDVILTGADTRQGMVTIRSLARRGVKVFVTGESRRSIGFYSRYVSGFEQCPRSSDGEAFAEFHADLARRRGVPFIFPVTESSLVPFNAHRPRIEEAARLIAPSVSTIDNAIDKRRTLAIAEELGIPISKTIYPDSTEDAVRFAAECGYPIAIKPRGQGVGASFDFKVLYAKSEAELREILAGCEPGSFPMIQEFSFGVHAQFNCFMEHGETAHSFFQDEALRVLPLTGGVGAMMISRPVNQLLAERAIAMFRAMRWEGCGQTQFKGPGRDGEYKFIEVSVRLPASVGSSVFSGIDTPWMQYCYFTGQPVAPVDRYRIGKRTRWLRGDTLTVFKYLVGDTAEAIDPLPSRARVLFDWFAEFFRPGTRYFVESIRDPVPGLVEFRHALGDLAVVAARVAPRPVRQLLKRIRRIFSGRN